MNDAHLCHYNHTFTRRPARLLKARLAFILMVCGLAAACVAPKRASLVIPRRCYKIDIQSFTQPCRQRADGKIVCNGVLVTASCIEVPR